MTWTEMWSAKESCMGMIDSVDCGAVVAVNALYEGDWNRNFEGEEDNSQCGAAADPNMCVSV